jgi:hypothetical protein
MMEIVSQALSPEEAIVLVDGIQSDLSLAWERYAAGCEKLVKAYRGRAWMALGLPDWPAFVAHTLDVDHLKIPKAERQEIIRILIDGGLNFREVSSATGLGLATIHRALNPVPNGTSKPKPNTPTHLSWLINKNVGATKSVLSRARDVDWTADPERAEIALDEIAALREEMDLTEAVINEMRRSSL